MAVKHLQFKTLSGENFITADSLLFHTADTYDSNDGLISSGGVLVYPYDDDYCLGNGSAIIFPEAGTVRQEKNGVYNLNLTLPITPDSNSWRVLDNGMHILKVPIRYHDEITSQLFRISKQTKKMDTSGARRMTLDANHIFYDLAWRCTESKFDLAGFGDTIFNAIFASVKSATGGLDERFSGSTDFVGTESGGFYLSFNKHKSLVAALMDGKDSFIGTTGGYLYRDNFRYSINKTMEGARDAGEIRYGRNMAAIDCEIDWSEICNAVFATNSTGKGNFYDHPNLYPGVPQKIYKSANFKYASEAQANATFTSDVGRWLTRYSKPRISIRINFDDIENIPLYKEFYGLRDYEVGDTVTIRLDELLGMAYYDMEIVAKEYDIVRQKTISIELGELRPSIARDKFWYDSVSVN